MTMAVFCLVTTIKPKQAKYLPAALGLDVRLVIGLTV